MAADTGFIYFYTDSRSGSNSFQEIWKTDEEAKVWAKGLRETCSPAPESYLLTTPAEDFQIRVVDGVRKAS
jgi:hypothetical protein